MYDPETDYTHVVWPLCIDCRENGLKIMNYRYYMFKKPKDPETEPDPEEEHVEVAADPGGGEVNGEAAA